MLNLVNVETLQEAQTRQWIFMENLKYGVKGIAMIYSNEHILVAGHRLTFHTGPSCQMIQYLNLAENTTGVYANTVNCDSCCLHFPGMYNVIGGNVSLFGGSIPDESCIQQTTSDDNHDPKWECVSRSESALDGLTGSSMPWYVRYSNFFF